MVIKYSFQSYNPKTMVKVVGRYLPLSLKTSVEVLNFIKGKDLVKSIKLLEEVAEQKRPIPFKKYKKDIPHRKGKRISVGRFPKKVSLHLINLLKLLQANAQDKGLNEKSLRIVHTAAQKGPKLWHYGRHRRRLRKVCHIELVAEEVKEVKK